jgi:spore coat protein CotH
MKNIIKTSLLSTFCVILLATACRKTVLPDDNGGIIPDPGSNDTIIPDPGSTVFNLYDISKLPSFTFEITAQEWNNLLSFFDINPNNEEYIPVSCYFQRDNLYDTIKSTGMKIRGNTSRRRPEGQYGEVHNSTSPDWHHASFAIKFNKYPPKTKLRGYEKVNLKWFKDDALYCREVYCYDLFERFGVWTAPQSSYCKVYIKIKEDNRAYYFGIYQMVEPVDENYLAARLDKFSSKNGNLWKANYGADLSNSSQSQMGLEEHSATSNYNYDPQYDFKSEDNNIATAKNQLSDFINNLKNKTGNDFKAWIQEKMDVDLFLKTYAVNVICGMWDDYWNNTNNFYLYFNAEGKFFFIPYDYDNTLGTSLEIGVQNNSGTHDPLHWGSNENRALTTKILAVPEFKQKYIDYLRELCDVNNDYFNVDKSIARIRIWHNLINGYVSNDTGEDMSIEDKPASWGNQGQYRLMTKSSTTNFFQVRAAHLP